VYWLIFVFNDQRKTVCGVG